MPNVLLHEQIICALFHVREARVQGSDTLVVAERHLERLLDRLELVSV